MRNRISALIGAAMLAFVSMSGHAAPIVQINLNGTDYSVTYTQDTALNILSLLEEQPWFGDAILAEQAAAAVGDQLGLPNARATAPFFAFQTEPFLAYAAYSGGDVLLFGGTLDILWAWAHVTGARVPEPGSIALIGASLAGLALMRRRRAAVH